MGIRMDQPMGLNKWARKFVEGESQVLYYEEIKRTYPDGRVETIPNRPVNGSSVAKEPSGENYAGYFEEFPLYKYTFPDGQVYCEKLQDSIDSAGPVLFLALINEVGEWVEESLWTEEEMEAAA